MCCVFTTLFFLGPRFAILMWWLLDATRWKLAFPDNFFWAFVGFIVLPWTTLMYVLVSPGGVFGFDWIWLAMALFADIIMWGGGGWGNKDRLG